ncbi:MAG: helix-turn-helix transcriptional regulator, partial [Lentilitoribacter sp.]
MSIGKRIRAARTERGQSQASFAESSAVSLRALKAYELDEREPPASFVLKLYVDHAINPTWLLSGDGPQSSKLRKSNISDAVIAVRTFASLKKTNFAPEKEAKLVLLLSEYFDEGG